MNKFLSLVLASVLLTACGTAAEPVKEPVSQVLPLDPFEQVTNKDWTDCSLAEVKREVEQKLSTEVNPEQITACRTAGDVSFAFVTQPNTWNALQEVRDWEGEGNTAWSGLLYKKAGAEWETFFKIPEEDFNPINLSINKEELVLDIADDSGAGSGEGKLLRYSYPLSGVAQENLGQWVKAKCDGTYVPETYSAEKTCQ